MVIGGPGVLRKLKRKGKKEREPKARVAVMGVGVSDRDDFSRVLGIDG